jgi:hypothetical protein
MVQSLRKKFLHDITTSDSCCSPNEDPISGVRVRASHQRLHLVVERTHVSVKRRHFCLSQGFNEQTPSNRIMPWSILRIICSSLRGLASACYPYNASRGNSNSRTEHRARPRQPGPFSLIVQLISFCEGVRLSEHLRICPPSGNIWTTM